MAFIIMIIFIGVAGYVYFIHVKQTIIDEKKNELATIAKLKVDQISQWRAERIGDASTIHHNSMLAVRLADYFAGTAPGTVLDEFKVWMNDLRKSYGYSGITLYKADGSLLVSYDKAGTQPDLISKQLIERAVRNPEVYFSDLHRDKDAGAIHLNLVIPIGYSAGKNFTTTAVMLLDIDPNKFLNPLIQTWPTNSKSAETMLVERSGQDALILNEMRYRSGKALSFRIPLTNENIPAVRAVLGQEWTGEGKDYSGVDVLAATRKIPGSPWAIVTKVDLSEIYGP
ncbi:MAG: cache domain-containing protein, partial [Deltaproteobacteria bacterium]